MKKKVTKNPKELVVYQTKSGALELRGDFKHETVWATQAQIGQLFGIERSVITKHIKNIYKEDELSEKATCAKIAQVQTEGNRTVERFVEHYNLDLILSVGYRVSSKIAIQFRIWATKTLKEHLTKGYTINKKVLLRNHQAFLKTVSDIQVLLPEHVVLNPKDILELVKEFASTWTSLEAYDKESLKSIGTTKKSIKFTGEELLDAITNLRDELIKKGEATEIFAQEKERGLIAGVVGNVMQSFGGKDLYPTAEEKAAHLLYFIAKDHHFVDGNKRSGAFSFIWFLRKSKVKGAQNITPSSLATLTLLIAESESTPKKMEQMIGLVTALLSAKKN